MMTQVVISPSSAATATPNAADDVTTDNTVTTSPSSGVSTAQKQTTTNNSSSSVLLISNNSNSDDDNDKGSKSSTKNNCPKIKFKLSTSTSTSSHNNKKRKSSSSSSSTSRESTSYKHPSEGNNTNNSAIDCHNQTDFIKDKDHDENHVKKKKHHHTAFNFTMDDDEEEYDNIRKKSLSLEGIEELKQQLEKMQNEKSNSIIHEDEDLPPDDLAIMNSDNNNAIHLQPLKNDHEQQHQEQQQQDQQHQEQQHQIEKQQESVIESNHDHDKNQKQQQNESNSKSQQPTTKSQPSGWRVKLYRLNFDGSWDDCGTGRICLIGKKIESTTTNNIPHHEYDENHNIKIEDSRIYSLLGEPTLFMHAETTNTNNTSSSSSKNNTTSSSSSKILLRTRVLLRKSYQRQGENIITWCEPHFTPTSSTTSSDTTDNNARQQQQQQGNVNKSDKQQQHQQHNNDHEFNTGVDLALSFQDNAGCLDIWNKISHIQLKAYEIYQSLTTTREQHQQQQPNDNTFNGGGDNANTYFIQKVVDNGGLFRHHENTRNDDNKYNRDQISRSSSSNSCNHNESNEVKYQSSLPSFLRRDNNASVRSHREYQDHDSNSSSMDIYNHDNHNNMMLLRNGHGQSPPMNNDNNKQSHHADWNSSTANLQQQQHKSTDRMDINYQNDMDESDHNSQHHQNNNHSFIETEAAAAAISVAAQYAGTHNHTDHHNQHHHHHDRSHEQSKQILQQLSDLDSPDCSGNITMNSQLPKTPKLGNLEEIADIIAAAQPTQRDNISVCISLSNCAYLKSLLALFPAAEEKDDYNILATLASIIKTIILFNEPAIIQLIVSDGKMFEDCCCCLEYDPDLRSKANHRWFIRDRLKFRTVVYMEDPDLVETIHKAFRVSYIRDTLLRPTMDESSLTTLSSLLTFTHAEVVKGVMCAPDPSCNKTIKSIDSYLVQVLRLLGKEILAIRELEWQSITQSRHDSISMESDHSTIDASSLSPVSSNDSPDSAWKQYLVPQDGSLLSRKIRRRGCLSFLRELFSMVRTSLQQSDKDDFYNLLVVMDVDLDNKANVTSTSPQDTVNLLSLLGAILSDINSDVSEKGACLEILSVIAMFDASLIRKHCLDEFSFAKKDGIIGKLGDRQFSLIAKPQPIEDNVIFACPPNDLLMSLLFLISIENDAGIMLQTSEVMRIILDTEMVNEACQLSGVAVIDDEDEFPLGRGNGSFQFGAQTSHGGTDGGSELNSFLQMFYDYYVPWFVTPFQYSLLVTRYAIPYSVGEKCDDQVTSIQESLQNESKTRLQEVPPSALRLSFSVELLSFCIRAHCFRFLLSKNVLLNVMKLLHPTLNQHVDGDRCLKLAVLRCLRSVLSLKDEFYNRHIVQHNLFTPVFEAFRVNPVGDNLVSSSIIEMCDFIRMENIKSLIEHIVTKHFRQLPTSSPTSEHSSMKISLEDVAAPYVDTLTLLRHKYEENKTLSVLKVGSNDSFSTNAFEDSNTTLMQNEKAREDQRKFREADAEDSYFFDGELHARPPSPAPTRNTGMNI